jgi:hypothetical protein
MKRLSDRAFWVVIYGANILMISLVLIVLLRAIYLLVPLL